MRCSDSLVLPNAQAHQGLVPVNGVLTNVGVNPGAKPYLDLLFPIPDGKDFGDGTAELAHSHQDPTDEHFGVVKLDYNLRNGSTLMVRWSRDNSDTVISQAHPLFNEQVGTETRYFTTQYQSIVTPKLLNTLRFAANRTGRDDDLVSTVQIPTSLYFTEDPHWGAIDITDVVDRRLDRDHPGRLQAGHLSALRHTDLDQEQPRAQGRVRLAELSLRRNLVFPVRRHLPVPQRAGVPDTPPKRDGGG